MGRQAELKIAALHSEVVNILANDRRAVVIGRRTTPGTGAAYMDIASKS